MIYEIWMSGFHIQGGDATGAHFFGKSEGNSFKEALINYYKFDGLFDPNQLTYWGCGLHETESEARKLFG
jgi:hypothetical protein